MPAIADVFIGEVARELNALYGGDLSRDDKLRLREDVFARSKAEWSHRIADRPLQEVVGTVLEVAARHGVHFAAPGHP